jgi:hypothetical protein
MTAGDFALIAFGILTATLALWALWPRSQPRAGPRNNWRQRSGNEVSEARTGEPVAFDSPYLAADLSDND